MRKRAHPWSVRTIPRERRGKIGFVGFDPMNVAIHQPNFVPWLGYFDRMIRADMFVLLDHVQFERRN